jgi:hypothetical protein
LFTYSKHCLPKKVPTTKNTDSRKNEGIILKAFISAVPENTEVYAQISKKKFSLANR